MFTLRSGIVGLTLTSALVLAATSANAADIYRREAAGGYKDGPVYVANSWTGFYIGGNGGYAFDANSDDSLNNGFGRRNDREGGFGGGQIGYNFGSGFLGSQFVFGVEADIQGSDISAESRGNVFGGVLPVDRFNTRVDYFGTVRGRIGYAFDRTLVYATGGFAYGNVKDDLFVAGVGRFSKEDTRTGYVVGGGIETKLSPNWSVKAEYQYINLDSGDNFTGTNGLLVAPSSYNVRSNEMDFHTIRAGINYHFHKEYEPLK